jgi:hypothetical protein
MYISDFKIGEDFLCGDNKWKCTDIGTRTITAINVDASLHPSWLVGPPYVLNEASFDEESQKTCTMTVDGNKYRQRSITIIINEDGSVQGDLDSELTL